MSAVGSEVKMRKADKDRKWMWWLLGSIAALQFYFVRELLAVFALFALGFLAIAGAVISLYALQRAWALTVDRVADSRHPVVVAVRHGIYSVEELARRPFRRPGSAQHAS
jgi:fumarate reductase subunit C